MEKEFYGNDNFNGNDGNASGKSFSSTFGSQESEQIKENEEKNNHPEFNHSNRRFDGYFLHFSSRL